MLFRPLDANWRMQKTHSDGRHTRDVAAEFIKPNDRLSSFERLELYNRQYWFRVLDCLYDDYPGLKAVLGERRFLALCRAYLARHPSESYTLRDLGSRLEGFLRAEPHWTAPREAMALDMARFEWAQIVAFDGPARPVVTVDDILDEVPGRLRLGIQPYLSLLELDHAVDHFLCAVRKREADVLRSEASNARDHSPSTAKSRARLRSPKREKVWLAVHRFDNQLYYKRLEPAAFHILSELRNGKTLEHACLPALGTNPSEAGAAQLQGWFSNWAELGWFCKPIRQSTS